MLSVLLTDRREDRDAQGRRHVKTEAEIGVLWSQAKESLEPTEGGRTKEGFTPRGSIALPEPWFWIAGLQNCVRINSFCFQSPSLWSFVITATGNQYKLLRWSLALHFLLVMLKKAERFMHRTKIVVLFLPMKLYWHHSDGQKFLDSECPFYFTYHTPNHRWSQK